MGTSVFFGGMVVAMAVAFVGSTDLVDEYSSGMIGRLGIY